MLFVLIWILADIVCPHGLPRKEEAGGIQRVKPGTALCMPHRVPCAKATNGQALLTHRSKFIIGLPVQGCKVS